MTRVFLAAGVAALAIAAPANAKPDRERGGQSAHVERGGGQKAQRAQRQAQPRAQRTQRVERQARAPRAERQQVARADRAPRAERQRVERQQRVARNDRVQRAERQHVERQQRVARNERAQRPERQRAERQQVRVADRQQRQNRIERQQMRNERQQVRVADRQQIRDNQFDRAQLRTDRQIAQINRQTLRDERRADRQILRDQQRWARMDDRLATRAALRTTRLAALDNRIANQFVAPIRVRSFIGEPVRTVSAFTPLVVMPRSISYLYPDTDDYYYRYGGGYVYRVDRDNDLINWVLPLLAGGFMPGQYLPSSYMNSYVPNYYGFNSFYPSSYAGYGYGSGYGYDNLCNRYVNGVIYQVDCMTGLIADINPIYAGGYGVGQMLPASYGYYNVPYQYRSLYYNTNDYNYWYAPGAIYQYDPGTSMITSVAALLSPGFTVGQPLPMGYASYNVPYAYRSTYYDTPNAWYRYNNGYIYQVDPATQLVTAIVASILT